MIFRLSGNSVPDVQDPGAPPALPVPRSGGGNAVYSLGKCYVFGGESTTRVADPATGLTSNGTYTRVEIFDVAKNSWRVGKVCSYKY